MDLRRWAFAVLPAAGAAAIGGIGARDARTVYARLDKPRWAPPAAAFGPVWSALYVGIGAAGWRLYASAPAWVRAVHIGQTALNAAWPHAFFGVRDKRASLAIIATLDAAVLAEIAALARSDRAAAALLAPYLGWTGFATALNATVSDPAEHG